MPTLKIGDLMSRYGLIHKNLKIWNINLGKLGIPNIPIPKWDLHLSQLNTNYLTVTIKKKKTKKC